MTIERIRQLVNTAPEYRFLRDDPHLGDHIILLGLGGSHAYGTEHVGSDVDIRGIALNAKDEILLGEDFGQVVDVPTDTVIYSFRKMMNLLLAMNPNTIEILGLLPEQYLYISPVGREILDHKELFLSRKCVETFGGYANEQLYRLNQKSAHQMGQAQLEKHILKTLEFMQTNFVGTFTPYGEDAIRLYIDRSEQEGYDTEIFMDVHLTHYPLRDYCAMWNTLQTTVRQYGKLGKRNEKALEHDKIAKHMTHLVRLFYTCFDLLEKGKIVTCRKGCADHPLLLDILHGKYIDEREAPTPEFFELVNGLEKRLAYDSANTALPELPNEKEVKEFIASVHERIVREEKSAV